MVEYACTCEAGFGVNHSHLYEWHLQEMPRIAERKDTGWIRIWIDWKAVARQLSRAA